MSFNISYVYQAIDKFTPISRRIGNSVEKVNRRFAGLTMRLRESNFSLKQFGANMRRVGARMTLFATTGIGALGFSMIKAASDAEEASSKFNTVFESISGDAESTAKNLAANFGLARTEAKELLGDTGDLLTGFGFTEDMALDLSKQVSELAVDLASFTNFSGGAAGASQALTKALLGERESVKSLGISILEEDVKRKVAILRAQGMTFETKRQAKAFATLQIAMDQSKKAQGDFARTSQGLANQARILNARFRDFRESFGKIMIPLTLKLVKSLSSLLEKFEGLSPTTKSFILIVAGVVAVLGPLLLLVGGIAAAVVFIGGAFTAAGVGIAAFVVAVVAGIGAAIHFVSKFRATIRELNLTFSDVGQSISNVVGRITTGIRNFISPIFDLMEKLRLIEVNPLKGKVDVDQNLNSNVAVTGARGQQSTMAGTLNINGAPQGSTFQSETNGFQSFDVGINNVQAGMTPIGGPRQSSILQGAF